MNKTVLAAQIKDLYQQLLDSADPRVKEWMFMDQPFTVISIVVLYLFILKHGPKHMANRKPYEFPRFLMFYNFSLVIFTAYVFYEMFVSALHVKFDKGCMTVDYSNTPMAIRMASSSWLYFFSKIVELLDTIFFIARKKQSQVTFLHVYHHSTMVLVCWVVTKFLPGGMKFFPALMNCFIHVLMYSYYGLAALGPHMQKYLWWKRYLTKLQIIQFILATSYMSYAFLVPCGYPRFVSAFGVLYAITFLSLFVNFYHKSYVVRASKPETNNNIGGTKSLKTQ